MERLKIDSPKLEEQKPLEETQGKPETAPDVGAWESEGGAVETQEEESIPETVVEEPRVEKSWREILLQAKNEFPADIQQIIKKESRGEKLNTPDFNRLDHFAQLWFREVFGMRIKKKITTQEQPKEKIKRPPTEEELLAQRRRAEEKSERKKAKKQIQLEQSANIKRRKMEQLHNALRNLDAGESVEEFIDETRRMVYFDKENRQYFVEEDEQRKNISIGDIVSDYAWGIKYFPDNYMADPTAYRTVAKRILVNEARRDLEKLHNQELIVQKPILGGAGEYYFNRYLSQLKAETRDKNIQEKTLNKLLGYAAEVAVREYLYRITSDLGLGFFVLRATVQEDAEFKYDFKIRLKHRIRGVDIESKNIKFVGFQLKTSIKQEGVGIGAYKKGKRVQVDDIVKLSIPGKPIKDAVKKWLEAGEPSGGPEQFLSPELKKAILKAVTEKLVDIPQEVFDKIE